MSPLPRTTCPEAPAPAVELCVEATHTIAGDVRIDLWLMLPTAKRLGEFRIRPSAATTGRRVGGTRLDLSRLVRAVTR